MAQDIILLELFSGIGGFHLGLKQAGHKIKKCFFSEIEPHAIANYKYNFKKSQYIGTVTNVRHIIRTINKHRKPTDRLIITFGSPCQDFSLAGKRNGLDGSKSSLIKYALVLIKWLRPDIYIWENVKGAFSTNDGADYWAIIQAFANIPGYGYEQQLVNTAWVLPQNRERIYFAGHLTNRSKPGLFPFITENAIFNQAQQTQFNKSICPTLIAEYGKIPTDGIYVQAMVRHRSTEPFKNEKNAPTLRNSDKGEIRVITNNPVCVAQRGRNPLNPNDRKPGAQMKQVFEENTNGITNTLTGAQKDNYIKIDTSINDNQTVFTNANYKNRDPKNYIDNTCTITQEAGRFLINNIRRLTEIECERLQGFPDNWTQYGIYLQKQWINKKQNDFKLVEKLLPIPKTGRYKLCGNAVTATIVKIIAEKIKFI
jgi:DNA (cytosine-5)-methyltransferase 1